VFKSSKGFILFVLEFLEKSKKIEIWEICIVIHFHLLQRVFPSIFLWVFVFQTLSFPHLSYIILSYSIRIFVFVERGIVCGWGNHQVVNPPWFVVSLFGRGWSEWCLFPLVRGGVWFLYPSSVEVICGCFGYGPNPSSVEVDCDCIAEVDCDCIASVAL